MRQKQVMPKIEDLSRALEINAIWTFDTEFPTIFIKSCTYITFKSAVKHRQLGYGCPSDAPINDSNQLLYCETEWETLAKENNKDFMHFKRLDSRHIHKETTLQKVMNGMDRIMCKTDPFLIRRHTNKSNHFSDIYFEAFSKSAYIPLWYSQFQ